MKRLLALLAVLAAVGSGVAGCATPTPAAVDSVANDVPLSCPVPVGAPLTPAVSHRANSPAGLPEPVRDLVVARAVAAVPGGATGSPISVIDVDGRPSLLTSVEYRPAAGNAYGRADQDAALLRGFDRAMSTMRADDPQIDVLAALDEAAAAAGRRRRGRWCWSTRAFPPPARSTSRSLAYSTHHRPRSSPTYDRSRRCPIYPV